MEIRKDSAIYSPKIITHNLEEFERLNKWLPIYHTQGHIEEWCVYIDSLLDFESNSRSTDIDFKQGLRLSAKRQREITQFIRNEQVLAALDSGYWEDRYAYLVDETGIVRKFKNRKAQEVLDMVFADSDEKQTAIQVLCLKGRQVGATSKVALKFIHRMMYVPNTHALMASVQQDKSVDIERKLDTAYYKTPFWLRPNKLPKRTFDNGSNLSIESGMQPKGIGQGKTLHCVHISEIGIIPNPKNVIEEGLLPAVHPSRNLFMVFEGTGSGNIGWFPDFWRDSKKNWPLGLARMRPVFIPWPMATDLYPEADWLREHPLPESFITNRLDATIKHVTRCESYIRNTPYLARVVEKNYQMPPEQQWYWEFEYRQAKEKHTLAQFAARMPADDFEALTGIHASVFDPETMAEIEDEIYVITGTERVRRIPVEAYAVTGHDVDKEFDPKPEQIDNNKQWIKLEKDSHRGQTYSWNLVPLKPLSEDEEVNTMDRLMVYESPQRGANYAIGIDTANGLGKEDEDRSVISVTKTGWRGESDFQVAEYVSNRLNSAQIVAFAAAVGEWYGRNSANGMGVKFAIEQVFGPGDTCQHQLKMMGFYNHHKPKRYDGKKIKDEQKSREGFYSNAYTVPILMDRFRDAVNGGWYVPRSRYLIEELRTLEMHAKGAKAKAEHREGEHDDRVRAAAQSYFTMHDMDILAERSQIRKAPPKKQEKPKGPGSANQMAVGDGW